jgi:hypothetical protein
MTTEPSVFTPKLRAFDSQLRLEVFHAFKLESRISLSLSSIVVGLAGAAAIVYVATRHGHTPAVPAAPETDAIETTGVTLVK